MSLRARIERLESRTKHRKVVIVVDDGAGSAAREEARLHAAGELDGAKLYIVRTGVAAVTLVIRRPEVGLGIGHDIAASRKLQ